MPLFIESFLKNRQFHVRLDSCYSDLFDQEMGVPQGSILSVTLFGLMINSIGKTIYALVSNALYMSTIFSSATDLSISILSSVTSYSVSINLQTWLTPMDSSSLPLKPYAYTSVNCANPTLLLNGTPVPVVEETKFLGIVFDCKLSFIPHIKHLKDKCIKALNLLRVLAHTSWGADQETLLHLYRSLIRSKHDYGCIVYGSARGSYLRMVDPIQNHALHLCLGAHRTSPTSSLCMEANEPPLYFRRKKLSLQYCLKLSCNYNNHAYATVFNSKFHSVFERKPTQLPPLAVRVLGDLQAVGFKKSDVIDLLHLLYQPHRLGF